MFLRRLYYDLTSGSVIDFYTATGIDSIWSVDDDFKYHAQLANRSSLDTGILEWIEPDEEIESKISGDYDVSVDLSEEEHKLIFTERSEPLPEGDQEATAADFEAALAELGV